MRHGRAGVCAEGNNIRAEKASSGESMLQNVSGATFWEVYGLKKKVPTRLCFFFFFFLFFSTFSWALVPTYLLGKHYLREAYFGGLSDLFSGTRTGWIAGWKVAYPHQPEIVQLNCAQQQSITGAAGTQAPWKAFHAARLNPVVRW